MCSSVEEKLENVDFTDSLRKFSRTKYMLCDKMPEEVKDKFPNSVTIQENTYNVYDPVVSVQSIKEEENYTRTKVEWFDKSGRSDFALRYVDIDVRHLENGGRKTKTTTTTSVRMTSFHEILNNVVCVKYEGTMKTVSLNAAYGSNTSLIQIKVWKSFAFPGEVVKMEMKSETQQSRTITTIDLQDVTKKEHFKKQLETFMNNKVNTQDLDSRRQLLIDEIVEYVKIVSGCELPEATLKTYRESYASLKIDQLKSCRGAMKSQAQAKQKKIALQAEARSRGAGSEKAKLVNTLKDLMKEKFAIANEMSNLASQRNNTASSSSMRNDLQQLNRLVKAFQMYSFEQLHDQIEKNKVEVETMRKKLESLRKRFS